MKNVKIILLVFIGVILICSFGCGGGGGGVDDEGNTELQNEIVSQLVDKILSNNFDSSPMIFDYAPLPDFPDESADVDAQYVNFVKYISSKDLNSDGEYIKTVHLKKDSEYVIKYSHGGRSLNNSSLEVRVTAPDKNEMVLDLDSLADIEISEDIIPVENLTEEEISALLKENGMTREELKSELEIENTENPQIYYVPVELEVIPEENPCIIMYIFKAPLTGDYEFAVSELILESEDLVVNKSPDIPFEFRIYGSDDSYSISTGEKIELYPEEILDIQRILLSSATEINENGLPVSFENNDVEASNFYIAANNQKQKLIAHVAGLENRTDDRKRKQFERGEAFLLWQKRTAVKMIGRMEEKLKKINQKLEKEEPQSVVYRRLAYRKKEIERSISYLTTRMTLLEAIEQRQEEEKRKQLAITNVIPDAVINNVPYDQVFAEGAGFHAHSGLRAVTKIVDDSAFRKNIVKNFSMPTPGTDNPIKLEERFNCNVIATQEEHDRTQELGAMSNFALLREALGYTQRQDYARLGTDHTKIISVRYELIETQPRTPDPKVFKIDDDVFDDLKKEGYKDFLDEYGDYFVAGYTWGNRYNATIEVVTEPGKSRYFDRKRKEEDRKRGIIWRYDEYYYVYDAASICSNVTKNIQDILDSVAKNAISERDKGTSDNEAKTRIENLFKTLESDFHDVIINVSHCTQTGRAGEQSFSLRGFADNLASFIKSAKQTPKYQYNKLYVTLRRFREIEALKPYIPEYTNVTKTRHNKIRTLNETIFRTRCYYNALMAIPASNLQSGASIQDQWKNEFETQLIMRMRGGLNRICADEKLIDEYQKKFNTLYEKYKALAERYNFYRYFVLVQRRSKSASWTTSDYDHDQSWSGGIHSYNKSNIVKQDIEEGRSLCHHHSEPWNKGPRGADFSGNFDNDDYIIWYKTGYTKTNYCQGSDVNGKTIGKNSYHWKYIGARSRRCEVYLELKTMKLKPELYPFAGLE